MSELQVWQSEPGFVCDASAVLAYVQNEPGADVVDPLVPLSIILSINFAEVLQKALTRGADIERLSRDLLALGLRVVPFPEEDAGQVARLWLQAPALSLADRACLVLARRVGLPALTSDRAWHGLDVGVDIRMIR